MARRQANPLKSLKMIKYHARYQEKAMTATEESQGVKSCAKNVFKVYV